MTKDSSSHYDTVASTFLQVSTAMIAIIGSLTSFFGIQISPNEFHKALFFATIVLLLVTTLTSLFSLLERQNTSLKRNLCIISVFPLLGSILLILVVIVV